MPAFFLRYKSKGESEGSRSTDIPAPGVLSATIQKQRGLFPFPPSCHVLIKDAWLVLGSGATKLLPKLTNAETKGALCVQRRKERKVRRKDYLE